jgi:protein O-mannosyl-transferase
MALGCVAIVAATFLAYAPALHAGFIWNDRDYVTAPALRSLHGLARIWFEPGATEQYYPVLHSAFWFEHRLWGDAAAGYHVVNVLLHALAACLVGLVARRLRLRGAWIAAGLFALHPVAVESVAWIAEQKNTLSTVFFLGAALVYLRFDEKRIAESYVAATGLFALAVLSKSVTAILPAALLLVFWWQKGALDWRRDIRPVMPWFAGGAAIGLFTAWVERTYIGASGPAFELGVLDRLLLAGRVVWFYFGKLVWPAELIFIYPRWTVSAADWRWFGWPIALGTVFVLLWMMRRRSRGPLGLALWYVGALFPVLGFFNVYGFVYSFVADHWQYLASIGVYVVFAAGAASLMTRATGKMRLTGMTAVVGLLGILGTLTWRQSTLYRDIETFYRTTLVRNPACWMAHNNLACLLAEKGRPAEAIPHFEQTLRLNPGDAGSEDNLGLALRAVGRDAEAMPHFAAAIALKPDFVAPRLHLARYLDDNGRPEHAIAQYEAVLSIRPELAEIHNDCGAACMAAGRIDAAAGHFQAAAQLAPTLAAAHMNWGNALLQLGRNDDALREHRISVQLAPHVANARISLGIALAQSGRLTEAIAEFETAVRMAPESVAARENLAHAQQLDRRSGLPNGIRLEAR